MRLYKGREKGREGRNARERERERERERKKKCYLWIGGGVGLKGGDEDTS